MVGLILFIGCIFIVVLTVVVFKHIASYNSMMQGIADYVNDIPESFDGEK